jgi:hypothetical protein
MGSCTVAPELWQSIADAFIDFGHPEAWPGFASWHRELQDYLLRAYAFWIRSLPRWQVGDEDYLEASRILGESLVFRIELDGGTFECDPLTGRMGVIPISCLTPELQKSLEIFSEEAKQYIARRKLGLLIWH